jgi:glucose-1-phosphate thymidylyltransferase
MEIMFTESAGKPGNIADEVIGLIPAGGVAKRISPLPCSKEIFPIGIYDKDNVSKPKVVSHYLLERMRIAGIRNVFFILRNGKWDIPAYYGDGSLVAMNIGYLMLGLPYGTPFTLNQAFPFVHDKIIAMGFPDILFSPQNAYSVILDKLYDSAADIVVGLFKTDTPHKMDMVDFDDSGVIRDIIIKPATTTLEYTWTVTVWRPAFTYFMHDYLESLIAGNPKESDLYRIQDGRELYVGDVFKAALKRGLSIYAVKFPDGFTMDIGTAEDLHRAISDNRKYNLIDTHS